MTNFNLPHRQAPIGVVANFLYALQKFGRVFAPLVVLFLLKGQEFRWGWLLYLVLFMVILLLTAYMRYRNFLFYIDDSAQSFVLESGVFNKAKVLIPLDKIQQVNINQSFINKLVGVFSVEVESAGSKEKEVVIDSVSYAVAQALRSELIRYISEGGSRSKGVENQDAFKGEEGVRHIGIWTLVKVGLTTNYIQTFLLLLVFVNSIFEQYIRLFSGEDWGKEQLGTVLKTERIGSFFILLLLAFTISMVLIVNLVRTLFRYYDFKIVLRQQTMVLSYGLFATRTTIIRSNRVQFIRVVQNFFQKKMNLFVLKINQVSGGEGQNTKTALQIPGCSEAEKKALLEVVYGAVPEQEGMELRPNWRYAGFRFFVFVLLPIAIAIAFLGVEGMRSYSDYLIAYSVLSALVVYRTFKVKRMWANETYIWIRSGFWDVSHTVVEVNKIQKVVISQYFWQRNADVGTLVLYTAGGVLRFETASLGDLKPLVDYWLYRIEKYNNAWM